VSNASDTLGVGLQLAELVERQLHVCEDDVRLDYATKTVRTAMERVNSGFSADYLQVISHVYEPTDIAWLVQHPPQWCGLFAMWCCQQNLLLTSHHWKVGVGIRPSLTRRPINKVRLADIVFFEHHGHHALAVPCDEENLIVLINGNGAAGKVSLSATTSLTLEAVGALIWSTDQ